MRWMVIFVVVTLVQTAEAQNYPGYVNCLLHDCCRERYENMMDSVPKKITVDSLTRAEFEDDLVQLNTYIDSLDIVGMTEDSGKV